MNSLSLNPSTPAELPTEITSRSQLPAHRIMRLTERPLRFPKDAEASVAVLVMDNSRSLAHKGEVWVVYTREVASTVHFASYIATIGKNYRIANRAVITPLLLRAIYEQTEQATGEEDQEKKKGDMEKNFEIIIGDAFRQRVSDIHIERRPNVATIRMRKHGQLMDYTEMGANDCLALVSVIHNVLAKNKATTFKAGDYQSASIHTSVGSSQLMLRYQSLPTYPEGFDVVLRLLPLGDGSDDKFDPLDVLGYTPSQVRDLLSIVKKPVGALIIAGTTGSGKSTTLKNLLMMINASRHFRIKVYTIEDPPEYRIPRVSQIPVLRNKDAEKIPGARSPFYEPLVATMRADPDILMIGEIRDNYTGDGLKKATQSGHQVLTTVHATSGLGIIERLSDFGIKPSVMGNPEFINGLVYQKLMPVLCTHCSVLFTDHLSSSASNLEDRELQARLSRVINNRLEKVRIHGPGCEHCGNMGVTGRTVCAEIIAPDFQMLKCFRTEKQIEAYSYWRSLSDGDPLSDNMRGKSALEHALVKVYHGLVSPHDVEDAFGPVDLSLRLLEQMSEDGDSAKRRSPGLDAALRAVSTERVSQGASPSSSPSSPFTADLGMDDEA